MIESQEVKCWICGKPETEDNPHELCGKLWAETKAEQREEAIRRFEEQQALEEEKDA